MKNQAFTLIELLVVILIIAILAAIAVPKYQKAVLKSHFSGLFINDSAIVRSLERYYLANGVYPTTLEDIDIEIGGCTTSTSSISCAEAIYYYYNHKHENEKMETFIMGILKNRLGLAHIYYTKNNPLYPDRAGRQWCRADSGNEIANQICQSMRGSPDGVSDFYGAGNTKSGWWNKYKLPRS